MRNVSFFYPEVFEYKFKRKPKDWSLEQLHDLYLCAKERAEKDVMRYILCLILLSLIM